MNPNSRYPGLVQPQPRRVFEPNYIAPVPLPPSLGGRSKAHPERPQFYSTPEEIFGKIERPTMPGQRYTPSPPPVASTSTLRAPTPPRQPVPPRAPLKKPVPPRTTFTLLPNPPPQETEREKAAREDYEFRSRNMLEYAQRVRKAREEGVPIPLHPRYRSLSDPGPYRRPSSPPIPFGPNVQGLGSGSGVIDGLDRSASPFIRARVAMMNKDETPEEKMERFKEEYRIANMPLSEKIRIQLAEQEKSRDRVQKHVGGRTSPPVEWFRGPNPSASGSGSTSGSGSGSSSASGGRSLNSSRGSSPIRPSSSGTTPSPFGFNSPTNRPTSPNLHFATAGRQPTMAVRQSPPLSSLNRRPTPPPTTSRPASPLTRPTSQSTSRPTSPSISSVRPSSSPTTTTGPTPLARPVVVLRAQSPVRPMPPRGASPPPPWTTVGGESLARAQAAAAARTTTPPSPAPATRPRLPLPSATNRPIPPPHPPMPQAPSVSSSGFSTRDPTPLATERKNLARSESPPIPKWGFTDAQGATNPNSVRPVSPFSNKPLATGPRIVPRTAMMGAPPRALTPVVPRYFAGGRFSPSPSEGSAPSPITRTSSEAGSATTEAINHYQNRDTGDNVLRPPQATGTGGTTLHYTAPLVRLKSSSTSSLTGQPMMGRTSPVGGQLSTSSVRRSPSIGPGRISPLGGQPSSSSVRFPSSTTPRVSPVWGIGSSPPPNYHSRPLPQERISAIHSDVRPRTPPRTAQQPHHRPAVPIHFNPDEPDPTIPPLRYDAQPIAGTGLTKYEGKYMTVAECSLSVIIAGFFNIVIYIFELTDDIRKYYRASFPAAGVESELAYEPRVKPEMTSLVNSVVKLGIAMIRHVDSLKKVCGYGLELTKKCMQSDGTSEWKSLVRLLREKFKQYCSEAVLSLTGLKEAVSKLHVNFAYQIKMRNSGQFMLAALFPRRLQNAVNRCVRMQDLLRMNGEVWRAEANVVYAISLMEQGTSWSMFMLEMRRHAWNHFGQQCHEYFHRFHLCLDEFTGYIMKVGGLRAEDYREIYNAVKSTCAIDKDGNWILVGRKPSPVAIAMLTRKPPLPRSNLRDPSPPGTFEERARQAEAMRTAREFSRPPSPYLNAANFRTPSPAIPQRRPSFAREPTPPPRDPARRPSFSAERR